jgi:hypothetical protein
MSLIYWWPLNGNIQDKIQGKIFNNSGWTPADSGKTGTTYNANIGAILSASLSIPNTFSFACWVKNNDLTYPKAPLPMKFSNGSPYSTANTTNKGWEFSHGNYSKLTLNNGSTVQELSFGAPHVSYLGSWYHLVFTVDCNSKKASLFINGELKGENSFTITDFSGTYTFSLGQIYGWMLDGFVNDLRIYDHALSQAEVKELSKALVIHYSFNDVLAEPTTNLLPLSQQTQSNTAATIEVTSGLVNGGTYTLSTNITRQKDCTSTNPRLTLRFFYSDGTEDAIQKYNDGGASYPKDGVERYYYVTATANSAKTLIKIGGWLMDHSSGSGKKMTATRSQLEAKDHATPYTPTNRESMLVNETGYAAPKAVTALQLSTITNNGSYSGYFDGQTSCIDTPVIKPNMFTEDYTLSFWVYPLDSGRAVYFGDHQISSVLTVNFERTADGVFRYYHNGSPDKSFANTNTPEKTWTMLTVTYTPGTMKVYKNGVLAETLSHTATITKNIDGIMRIGRDNRTGSDYGATPLYGYISDFRFYTTCLSSDDIKDLYQTKAYISDKGDIMCGEFIEDKSQAQVTNKGAFEANEFCEDFDISGGYERVEYIEFSGTQYIDTGLAFTDANIPIIIEADVVKTVLSGNNCLAGCGIGSSWHGPVMLNFHNSTLEIGVNGYATASDGSGSIAANERMSVRAEIYTNGSDHKWYKNGNIINLGTKAYNTRTSSDSTLYIGAFHNGTNNSIASGSYWTGRLYSFKVWYGTSCRILIPAKRKSDNACGLYDMAGHNFYTNIGGGSLSGGSVVTKINAAIYEDQRVGGREIIEL